MTTPITGGCACGALRYECTAEPIEMFLCHCRDCQRASGGPYAPAVLLPSSAFKFTRGAAKIYTTPSEMGGRHPRGFCAECGSRVLGLFDPELPFLGIAASSLDDPSGFRPKYHIFVSDAQPWDHIDPTLPKFEKYAPFPEESR